MSELDSLINMSLYAGERFDLVQAGGGNSSVKLSNGEMLIKASGLLLSEVSRSGGYARVNTQKISDILDNAYIKQEKDKKVRETLTAKLVREATLDENRPSIETLLHSLLYQYTLHIHPVVVNMVVIRKNYREILSSIFEDTPIACIDYRTPGIDLALALNEELKKFDVIPNIIFLQNHGLIVSSSKEKDIKEFVELVLTRLEKYLQVDMGAYKLTNKISDLLRHIDVDGHYISYLSDDIYLNQQLIANPTVFSMPPFCPDSLVYCGVSSCSIDSLQDLDSLVDYERKYFELPKVICYQNRIFFIAKNIRKAKEMEEVLKFHIMVLVNTEKNERNFLEMEELAYLNNWEAEKYRKQL